MTSYLIASCSPCNRTKSDEVIGDPCYGCPRPMCGGPDNPRDELEEGCACSCHGCDHCGLRECAGMEDENLCPQKIEEERHFAAKRSTA